MVGEGHNLTHIIGVTISISDKVDCKARKEEHNIMIKGSILQEDITVLNVYVPNNGASKYVR